MRLENAQVRSCPPDPRQVLCDTKYFGLRPEPLEQYLYGLALSQTAERVFWLHWTEGYRRGNFTSEISLKEAARRCHCDTSTVTKAYQILKRHKLIRRQDPGRDPTRPFEQAIALTEVRLPPAALGQLFSAPDRGPSRSKLAGQAEQPDKPAAHIKPTAIASLEPPKSVLAAWAERLEKLRVRLDPRDFETNLRPLQPHQDGARLVLYAPNRFVQDWLAQHLQPDLAEMAAEGVRCEITVGARPQACSATISPAVPAEKGVRPRPLSTFSLARLRKDLSRLSLGFELQHRLQEIAWSIERGALSKHPHQLAINIALKKVREGAWTRPNRMPPNWQLPAA